ncbi:methylated-DNA--[protein]-cysteine S-methyltransferase [uncultured Shewanella sp.]|uniref:methylated-DNA--[protein]-cysteine S-methyltransferase n=1 Tax=uncultured Shewanella sp. TaxID=173975 RepID=UPI002627E016|nr:methylated-DNA--[protein]-cysteine S-methyltransferase [uncultured Shewanella sp.]
MKINNHPPIYQQVISSPVGNLKLQASEYGLTHLQVLQDSVANDTLTNAQLQTDGVADAFVTELSAIEPSVVERERAKAYVTQAVTELGQYFKGERQTFDVKLAAKGTEFQHQVWHALTELNFGEICSYAAIADKIVRPKAVRAVGAANGANPIAIIVPCHRVIGKNGSLTGYAYGLEMKQYLLNLEGVNTEK